MIRSLKTTVSCIALALAVPSGLMAADACYLPQSTACYPSSQPAACHPLQSSNYDVGAKNDVLAFLSGANLSVSDEVKSSQSAKEQTVYLTCPAPHAETGANTIIATN